MKMGEDPAMSRLQTKKPSLVVLVEEETDERLFIAEQLDQAGFRVLQAETADAGLRLLEDDPEADALVTDAHVPGEIDGYELAQVARDRWPNLTVVMMSGHSDETSGPLPQGAIFVSKPNLTTQLIPALQRAGL
jgi:DNA-binding response OmpR family regulator